MVTKTAAIEAEKLGETTLDKLSAAQFVEALQAKEALHLVGFWPEKKKFELETEPGLVAKLRFREFLDIVDRVKGEKKKAEYELEQAWRWRVDPHPDPWRARLGPTPEPSVIATRLDQLAAQVSALAEKLDVFARQ